MASKTDRTAAVHLLADHLDAILAAGEDMIGLRFDPSAMIANGVAKTTEPGMTQTAETFVRQVAALELGAALRVIAARTRTEELIEIDNRFDAISKLFLGGTAAFVDAAERAGINAAARKNTAAGQDPVSYLRLRGVISETSAGLPDFEDVEITEAFLLCGVAEVGGLLDMTAAFLDALEIHYELFPITEDADTTGAIEQPTKISVTSDITLPTETPSREASKLN